VKGVTVAEHPLVRQSLTRLRDQSTTPQEFRRSLGQLTTLLVYEATRDLETRPVRVRTPLAWAAGTRLRNRVLLVPILRAGLGMLNPLLDLIPGAVVGFIGLHRNEETLEAEHYHNSTPSRLRSFDVLLIDPMLATGGSALSALEDILARGARRVRLVTALAAPEGIRAVRRHHPKLPIYTAAIDKRLNDKGYIVPGLGDAGDRVFGT
jgi:uracil phosphoribosyltransferase